MWDEQKTLRINSYNCRGLRNPNKRQSIFTWLKNSHPGITLIQESHSVTTDEIKWQQEWVGKSISHMENLMQGGSYSDTPNY